ncbi:TadE/TadG family type IV pilus assembly protein [Kangsaoukella pontilimi]|uniref:TadE/TadG family type IV pilus assembly protein n=1 Tax=Kangsaoukella pontilimi TaxID=2691042 RepID=UPI00136AE798|nr:hypothetical protein [Kangsaoukella pontilimi]
METVIWLPFFIAAFGFMVDLAMIFNGQAKVLRVLQDVNREYSVGNIASTADTEKQVLAELSKMEIWPSAASTTQVAGNIRSTVVIPTRQLTITHFFGAFASLEVDVTADMTVEYFEG